MVLVFMKAKFFVLFRIRFVCKKTTQMMFTWSKRFRKVTKQTIKTSHDSFRLLCFPKKNPYVLSLRLQFWLCQMHLDISLGMKDVYE